MEHSLRRATQICACAVLIIATIGAAVAAPFVPKVGYASDGGKAVVNVNSQTAIRFSASNGNLSPIERARITAERLAPLASTGGWKSITTKNVGPNRAQVMVGDKLICIVTAADAKAARTTASSLAASWARNLKRLFSLPPVVVKPTEITVPLGETRSAVVTGASRGSLTTTDSNAAVAVSRVDAAKRAVVVEGKSVGRCSVVVDSEGHKATLVVNVKRYAARLGRVDAAEVTGIPAPASVLREAAIQRTMMALRTEPGANINFGTPKLGAPALKAGESTKAIVPVRVTGPGLIPVDLDASVDIVNRTMNRKPVARLFYSNNPEQVKQYGNLFAAELIPNERKRLLYHHQNMMQKPMEFVIEVINAGDTPAALHAVGSGAVLVDTVVVGYLAGRDFIHDYLNNVGIIYNIPAKSKLVVRADHLKNVHTASGIIDFEQMAGERLFLRVRAIPPGVEQVAAGIAVPTNGAAVPDVMSEEVFPTPVKEIKAEYSVGGQWAFIRIGKDAISDALNQRTLQGNYGVMYRITVDVSNPSADARKIQLTFDPTAGPASGLFLFDGKIIGTKIVTPPNEFDIASVRLEPGESKKLTITTIPLSGSAYPATIVVKS